MRQSLHNDIASLHRFVVRNIILFGTCYCYEEISVDTSSGDLWGKKQVV